MTVILVKKSCGFYIFIPMKYSMTLNNFEEKIDSRILERGLNYYQDDHIFSIEQIDQGIWEAIVSGTEEYEITVHLLNHAIVRSSCNCPYDLGDYCKHEVAVFNFLKYSPLAKKPTSGKMQKVKTILDDFTPEELKTNFLEILKYHRNVRDEFLEDYGGEESF